MKEECGVMGAYDFDGGDVGLDIYHGLYTLQHRGQESCGIVTNDFVKLHAVKGKGLVNSVFNAENLCTLKGKIGVGHVRYGYSTDDNGDGVPPIVSRYCKGTMVIATNGNITNYDELRSQLEQRGAIFQSLCHAELIMNLIAIARTKTSSAERAVLSAAAQLKGAYSIVVMSPKKLIAIRDPYGFRPLSLGKRGNRYFFASEDAVFGVLKAEKVCDVLPGELIKIDDDGITHIAGKADCVPSPCIFEYVYFARPDSFIDGNSVYNTRINIGRALYDASPAKADVIVGVPDSGLTFALGYSYQSGIPYADGLVKNPYVGRTFIKSDKLSREEAVSVKLTALKAAIDGKDVVLIDDSIVRGTTCAHLIKMLKDGGAKRVHMRIASPPFLWPCYYGTDVPDCDSLIANRMTTEQICEFLGADSLSYLPVSAFDTVGLDKKYDYCKACFTGKYPDRVK